ncbi:MAG: rod shape-determining protein RodA [Epsilonproteobacteria bacterium]|nr:rod shape-determining protein RodA [Campylobacterota bacterium]
MKHPRLVDRRILTHFDFFLPLLILPLILVSLTLVREISPALFRKELFYIFLGMGVFVLFFLIPWRAIRWLIPFFYWGTIALLVSVDLFGVTRLGAQRWLELPIVGLTIQPSELFKPAFLLMLGYLVNEHPPPPQGYGLKEFLRFSFHILLPFVLIAKEPDLGTALVLLIIGYGTLFLIGVNWKIWASIAVVLAFAAPFMYNHLHDYQKKRIHDFLSEKPSYHVQQSIIAIGSGGMTGKPKEEATQTQLKFLPIASSDFIFAYFVERFGFVGAAALIALYATLILHILSLGIHARGDYYIRVTAYGIALLLFVYTSVNILMTIGLAPVVGVPLPLVSHGGSSFINFMVLFGILENFIAFRFNFLYNHDAKITLL